MSDHKIQDDRILGGRYVATAFISPCQLWPYWLHPFVVGGNCCIANNSKYRLCKIMGLLSSPISYMNDSPIRSIIVLVYQP